MSAYAPPTRDRIPAAIAAIAIPAALLWALVVGLGVRFDTTASNPLDIFTVLPDPPPPVRKVEKRPSPSHRPEGQASPPNLRSRATEIVAPPPPIPLPPVVVTAPEPLTGTQSSTGSAEVAGPGTGAGGIGDGLGSGNGGDGDGGGGDETPPRQIGGRIRDSDFPDALRETSDGGLVGVRYTVLTSGRVANCRITRPSGVPLLDQTTCRLIVQRFRYRPSRDSAGRAVQADIVETHEWVNEMTAADFAEPPPRRRRD
ncbi:MAG: TonB family protein [Pseudomonadota bacterium]